MPITPKLHVLTVHMEQRVDMFGRSLGMEGEHSGEAVHHVWKRQLSNLGKPPKDSKSVAFGSFMLRAVLIFNATNI